MPIALDEGSDGAWLGRDQLFNTTGEAAILKVAALPGEVCAVVTELQQWANAEQIEIKIVAQAFGLIAVAIEPATHAAIAQIERLRARLHPSGGSVFILQIPTALRGKLDVWDCNSNALPLMREIKRRFDPNRILNPGRFVGNI